MSGDFLDTNVLIYLLDERDARKHGVSRTIVSQALQDRSAVISHQVVQETLNVLSRGLTTPIRPEDILETLERVLSPLWRVMPSRDLYRSSLRVQQRYGFSFYDAVIIAAALDAGCTRLLSEDLQHGQRIEGLVIENPFL